MSKKKTKIEELLEEEKANQKQDPIEERKFKLVSGDLDTSKEAVETVTPKVKQKDSGESGVVTDNREGMNIAGVSGRKKVNKKSGPKKMTRGSYKIWEDKEVENVGEGVNTYDISKRRV